MKCVRSMIGVLQVSQSTFMLKLKENWKLGPNYRSFVSFLEPNYRTFIRIFLDPAGDLLKISPKQIIFESSQGQEKNSELIALSSV